MYNEFAYYYDQLMSDVEYDKIGEFIKSSFAESEANGFVPEGSDSNLLVDLGCGTGSLMSHLLDKGYDVIGIDPSEEMLQCAREKFFEKEHMPLLLCQSASEMELFGTVAGIISSMDCLNHITDEDEFKKVFDLTANYLDNNGLFIFDVLSSRHFQKTAEKGAFHDVSDEVVCLWQCEREREWENTYRYDITFFIEEEDGLYERFDESFCERWYDRAFIEGCVSKSGMELLGVYDGYTDEPADEHSDRLVFVCRRPAR